MKTVFFLLVSIFSSIQAQYAWHKHTRLIPGCHAENILDCVASFEGRMCVDGDVGFKRDCFDCQCNAFGYWKCRNYCVNAWADRTKRQTINLMDLQPNYSVSATPLAVYDVCIPGKRFLRDANKCQICYCSADGHKSTSYDCKKVWWC